MRRNTKTNRLRTHATRRAAIDALEPRRMLAVYDGDDGLTSGPDTVLITTVAQFHRVTINGTAHTTSDTTVTVNTLGGDDVISVADTLTNSIIVVNAAGGNDTLQNTVRDLDAVFANFLFLGGSGTDSVIADNEADSASNASFRIQGDGILKENPDTFLIHWTTIENVSYRDNDNPNTIRFVNLQGNIATLAIRTQGGDDTVLNFAEFVNDGDWGTSFGTGEVFVNTGDGSDQIFVADLADPAGASFVVNSTSVESTSPQHNTGPLTYLNCEDLILAGSTHSDSFNVTNTVATMRLAVSGYDGDDTFTVGGGDIDANLLSSEALALLINGGGGNDSIVLNDINDTVQSQDRYFIRHPTGFEELLKIDVTQHFVRWSNVEGVTLEASNDASSISVSGITTPTRINGNGGNDFVDVNRVPALVTVHTGLGDMDWLSVGDTVGDPPTVVVVDQTDDVEVLSIRVTGTLRVNSGAVLHKTQLGPDNFLSIGGVLDLHGAFLSSGTPSDTTFKALLVKGYNGGAWNGNGPGGDINSSLAAGSALPDAVGYGLGSEIGISTIGGFNIAAGDTLVRYTYYGDADLNGKVDGADYARIDSKFNQQVTQGNIGGWVNGDFDYNDKIDGADYALIDAAFNSPGPTLRPAFSPPPLPAMGGTKFGGAARA